MTNEEIKKICIEQYRETKDDEILKNYFQITQEINITKEYKN